MRLSSEQRNYFFFSALLLVSQFSSLTIALSRENTTSSFVNEKSPTSYNWCQENSGIRVNSTDRLRRLRTRIRYYDYAAYIIGSADEHQSEYPSNYDKRMQYITGFSGSTGFAVVLVENDATLWLDGRYSLQASKEVDCNWRLMKDEEENLSIEKWLISKLKGDQNKRVAADPKLISQKQWQLFETDLSASGLSLVPVESNLVDEIWSTATGRAPEPDGKVFVQPFKYTGKLWEEKVKLVREELSSRNLDALIVSELEEVAWILNMRGSDVIFVPVFKSFLFLTANEIKLYIKQSKIDPSIEKHLNVNQCKNGGPCQKVEIRDYNLVYSEIKRSVKVSGLRVLMSLFSSFALYKTVDKDSLLLEETPIRKMMVIKNSVEREGLKKAHSRDCLVLSEFFAILEKEVQEGKHWDELSAGKKIDNLRRQEEMNRGPSFESISAFGSNAAQPHYSPQLSSNKIIDTSSLYLLDSGGQYLDGTTDITRTMHFGTPTDFQKEVYTRVLQGVIGLASVIFPNGTKDNYIEYQARQFLYNIGLDYPHGTGHGIGSYLNVHEYPPLISSRSSGQKLLPGMFFSIEPGYYEEGQFGIRLETIFTVVEAQTEYRNRNRTFFKFHPVSFLPFEPKLIKYEALTKDQIKWLNDYNAKTNNSLGLELRRRNKQLAYQWVMARTQFIPTSGTTIAIASNIFVSLFFILGKVSSNFY